MRFDTPIYFQRITQGEYDETTGNYAPDKIAEEKRFAAITDSSAETIKLVYGDLKQGALTIRLQGHYTKPFDCIRIGDGKKAKKYCASMSRQLRTKHVFVVSEVQ